MADHAQVDATMAHAVAERGAPDVLINCAGRAYPDHFEDVTYAQFAETHAGQPAWLLEHHPGPAAAHAGQGHGYIVNTSSIAGLIGVFGYTDYCASKFALVGFSEALRSELAPHGIGVSVLCPPDTDTPGLASENLTKPEETRAISAGAKLMSAEAVADALLAGLAKRELVIVPGADGRLAWRAKRLVPGLVDRLIARRLRRAR